MEGAVSPRGLVEGAPDDAATPWRDLSPRAGTLRRWQVLLVAVPSALALGGGLGWVDPLAGLGAAALVAALAGLTLVLVRRRLRAWGYAERADDLMVRRGLLVRRLSVVPYGRMQFVDVTSGPLARRLGLAEVRLHTAASASDARIPALDAAEADRLRDRLAALGEARAAGL